MRKQQYEWAHFKLSLTILTVGGGDTAHGGLPWLVSPPASDNLKCTHTNVTGNGTYCIFGFFKIPTRIQNIWMAYAYYFFRTIFCSTKNSSSVFTKAADILKPVYFQFISPFTFIFGAILIYCII